VEVIRRNFREIFDRKQRRKQSTAGSDIRQNRALEALTGVY